MIFVQAANAALIGVEDHGDYFTDTTNGLDWYDVTLSVNRTYNDVVTQFGVGGDYEGWRYASSSELAMMVNVVTAIDTGVTSKGQYYGGENEQFYLLTELLGSTVDSYYLNLYGADYDSYHAGTYSGNFDATLGLLSDISNKSFNYSGYITDDDTDAGRYDMFMLLDTISPSYSDYGLGSYLVRDTVSSVSIPAILPLFLIGLVGFLVAQRRR